MGVLKPMLFYGDSKTRSILWRFQNSRYFTEVSKFMVINRVLNPQNLTEILKLMLNTRG